MKPLLVLALVIGAMAVLLFGVFSLLKEDPTPVEPPAPAVVERTVTPAPTGSENLHGTDAGARTTAPTDPKAAGRATTRSADGAFQYENMLTGLVKNAQGAVLADVDVKLTTAGVTDFFIINDPFGSERDQTGKTNKEGRYQFKNIEPRNRYTLILTHKEYSQKVVSTIPVGDEGVFEEMPIVMTAGATLSGYVRDTAGNLIPEARLDLDGLMFQDATYTAPDRISSTTNGEGRYTISNIPRGQRSLTVSASGYGSITINGLNFDASETVNRDVTLKIAEMISGRVIGPNNSPIVGARVMAMGVSATQQSARVEVESNAQGEFLFDNLSPGSYNVIAHAAGYRFERSNMMRIETGTSNVILEGQKEATVCGFVVDASTGNPVTSFTIRMRFDYGEEAPSAPSEITKAFSSPKGEYCIDGIPAANYIVEAITPGYAPGFSERFTITPGKSVNGITVRMPAGGTLSGRVVDPDGKPVALARITTHDNTWSDDEFTQAFGGQYPTNATAAEVRTGEDGRFTIPHLNPEVYQINVRAPNHTLYVQTDIQVKPDQETQIPDVRLTRGGSLRGTLFDPAGKPLAGGRIVLRAIEGLVPARYESKTGQDGKFTITNISAPCRYELSALRSPSGIEANPFEMIVDAKGSRKQILITDDTTTVEDLYLNE